MGLCSCGSVWYDGVVGEGCLECGGYAMKRPCPVCGGQCGRMWTRSTDMVRVASNREIKRETLKK